MVDHPYSMNFSRALAVAALCLMATGCDLLQDLDAIDYAPLNLGEDAGADLPQDLMVDEPSDVGDVSTDQFEGLSETFQGRPLLHAKYVDSPQVVDGITDEAYEDAQPYSFEDPSGQSDNTVSVRALWTDQQLYLLFQIADQDIVPALDGQIWKCGSIDMYVDPLRTRSEMIDADDIQVVADAAGNTRVIVDDNHPEVVRTIKHVSNASGFSIEMAISWDSLGVPPQVGVLMGLLIATSDCDQAGVSRGFSWDESINGSYRRSSPWGALRLVE